MIDMRVHFLITTYNRKTDLKVLLDSIDNQEVDKSATIIDDCSGYHVRDLVCHYPWAKLIVNEENYGKKYFWKTTTKLYQSVKDIEADYFVSLQDDFYLLDHTLNEAIYYWENIQDKNKIALNIHHEFHRFGNGSSDVKVKPIVKIYDNALVLRNQWCDHKFICKKRFFEILNYNIPPISLKRWEHNPDLPSGVGGKTSKILVRKGYNIYTCPRPLLGYNESILDSQMNPNRDRSKWEKYVKKPTPKNDAGFKG